VAPKAQRWRSQRNAACAARHKLRTYLDNL